jgi:uncharacterized protein
MTAPRPAGRAGALIAALELAPHPEGGYYREIHRSATPVEPSDGRGPRAGLTTIYFLLAAGEASRWHRVMSDETWHFHEGAPLDLWEADPGFGRVERRRLGPLDGTTRPVRVIGAGAWQAARSAGDYTLVSCSVGPGFDFADFAMLRDDPAGVERVRTRRPELLELV